MSEIFPRFTDTTNRRFTWMNNYDTDKKIVIFGDSYAHSGGAFVDKDKQEEWMKASWYGVLHHRTQRQIWNYGEGGTSLQYSKQNLFRYLDKHYDPSDWIIFISTSYTRIPQFPDWLNAEPRYQALILPYLIEMADKRKFKEKFLTKHENRIKNSIPYQMFYPNRKAMEWVSHTLVREDFINELRMLQVFLNSLTDKTLLMPAFRYEGMDEVLDMKEFSLTKISESEPIHDTLFSSKEHPRTMDIDPRDPKKQPQFEGWDPRKQHMSNRNNEVLGVKIDNYFKNGDMKTFSLNGFEFE